MAVQIQMRRGTASQWTSSNPTLAAGEWGLETDTDKFKIGDGSTAWNSITNYSSLGVGTAGGTFAGTINFGTDGSGQDVNFYSDTAGDSMVWDSSAESLTITGTDGQTALNVADGNVVIADSLTAGTITSGTVTMGDDRIDGAMLKDYSEKGYNVGTTGAITRDFSLTNGNTHWTTLTGNATFTFSYPVASGDVSTLTLIVTQDGTGSRTIAWPGAVDWAGGTAPTISTAANAVDIFTFITHDAGTTWYGFAAGLDMKSPS